jgi:hypothetical protein
MLSILLLVLGIDGLSGALTDLLTHQQCEL